MTDPDLIRAVSALTSAIYAANMCVGLLLATLTLAVLSKR